MKKVERNDKMDTISKMTVQKLLNALGNREEGIKENDDMKQVVREMKRLEEELSNIIHESNILLSKIKEERCILESVLGGGRDI